MTVLRKIMYQIKFSKIVIQHVGRDMLQYIGLYNIYTIVKV